MQEVQEGQVVQVLQEAVDHWIEEQDLDQQLSVPKKLGVDRVDQNLVILVPVMNLLIDLKISNHL